MRYRINELQEDGVIGWFLSFVNFSKIGFTDCGIYITTQKLTKEKDKLLRDLGGIRDMHGLPQAVFIVDPKREEIAVKEARKLKIPIVGLVDTNCDPDLIDYPIPGNDDALKAIKIVTSLIGESIKEGRKEYSVSESIKKKSNEDKANQDKEATTVESSTGAPIPLKE